MFTLRTCIENNSETHFLAHNPALSTEITLWILEWLQKSVSKSWATKTIRWLILFLRFVSVEGAGNIDLILLFKLSRWFGTINFQLFPSRADLLVY